MNFVKKNHLKNLIILKYLWYFISGVHCWTDAWSRKSLAQRLFHLQFVQQTRGFLQPLWKRRRNFLQSLLWKKFWTQRIWIWDWCWMSTNDLKNFFPIFFDFKNFSPSLMHKSSECKTQEYPHYKCMNFVEFLRKEISSLTYYILKYKSPLRIW